MDSSLRRLIDRTEIAETLARYARGIDRRDWEQVRAAFFADAEDDHGDFKGTRDAFIDWISERHTTIAKSSHYLCNCIVDFLSETSAATETYFIARMRVGANAGGHRAMLAGDNHQGENLIVEVCGRYLDRFDRRDGAWRIAKRTTVFDFLETWPAPDEGDHPLWAHGERGRNDPLYRFLPAG